MPSNNNKLGKFITIEGQDGAGKSTNVAVIEAYLKSKDIDYVHTREPGGTELGERLRDILLNGKTLSICDDAELLLIFAARAQHIQEVILPTIKSGKWVVCDRFTDATYAYQGGGRELELSQIAALENLVQGALRPDLTLLLDLPVEIGIERAGQRSEPDRFEIEQTSFKNRVRAQYLQSAQQHPERIKLIDASQNQQSVADQIEAILTLFSVESSS